MIGFGKNMQDAGDCARILAVGHISADAGDPRQFGITNSEEWAVRPGAVAFAPQFDPKQIALLRGRVLVQLSCGDASDSLEATISPMWQRERGFVFRRDTLFRSRDFAVMASKAAADLDEALVANLRLPGASLEILIRSQATSQPVGSLAFVALPIGHQGDLSPRALDVLSNADLILAEDTRIAGDQLRWRGVRTPIISYHSDNEVERVSHVVDQLRAGARVAVISDAGSPLISDPGRVVLQAAAAMDAIVTCIPGPSAVIAALTLSGLISTSFRFSGFPPRKGPKRASFLQGLVASREPTVLFEAPSRISALLDEISSIIPDRPAAVCRDITKSSEAVFRGRLVDLAASFRDQEISGEYTLVIGENEVPVEPESADFDLEMFVGALIRSGCPSRSVMDALKDTFGMSRNEAYALVQRCKSEGKDESGKA